MTCACCNNSKTQRWLSSNCLLSLRLTPLSDGNTLNEMMGIFPSIFFLIEKYSHRWKNFFGGYFWKGGKEKRRMDRRSRRTQCNNKTNLNTRMSNISFRFPWWFSGKESACQCRRHRVRKSPWRRKRQSTSVFLSGKCHGSRSLVCYSLWSHKRVRHDLVTK